MQESAPVTHEDVRQLVEANLGRITSSIVEGEAAIASSEPLETLDMALDQTYEQQ